MALERAPIRAVIFDMDGVITDSEPLYAEAVNATIDSTPHRLSATDHMAIMGSSIEATWDYVIDRIRTGRRPGALGERVLPGGRPSAQPARGPHPGNLRPPARTWPTGPKARAGDVVHERMGRCGPASLGPAPDV